MLDGKDTYYLMPRITYQGETVSSQGLRKAAQIETVGRYSILGRLGAGGMGAVFLGRTTGAAGFSRAVAIKRLHSHYAEDPTFVSRFKDEVRVSASVQHPNVVETLDVLSSSGELLLVMEYIDGATLHALLEDATHHARRLPLDVVSALVSSCLHGIHAVHETTSDDGVPLCIVHRDISPQNLMIGRDGQVKVLDFGLAQAVAQSHLSQVGAVSGKSGYMSPEQIRCEAIDRRTDVFASGIVLWEALTGQRLFRPGKISDAAALHNVLTKTIRAPSELRPGIPSALDDVTLRALNRDPEARFATAREFALALEAALAPATPSRVANCLLELCCARLARRAELLPSVRRGLAPAADATVVETSNLTVVQTGAGLDGLVTDARKSTKRSRWIRAGKQLLFSALVLAAALASPVLNRPAPTPESRPNTRGRSSIDASSAPPAAPDRAELAEAPAPASAKVPVRHSAGDAADRPPAAPRTSSPATRSGARGASRKARPQRAPLCSPPTFVDNEGIRHFKEGCI